MFISRVGNPASGRRTFGRSAWITVSCVAFVALGSVSAAGAANRGVTPVPGGALENVTPSTMPLGVGNAVATYIVQLSGDPVVLADAKSKDRGGPLSESQKQQLKDQLKAQQAPAVQKAQDLGGTVTAQFQASGHPRRGAARRASPERE